MQRKFYKQLANPNYYNDETLNAFEPMAWMHEDISGGLALDFGCGVGRAMQRWESLYERIDGCDLMPEYLEIAREKMPASNFYALDGVSLDGVPSDTYDVVYSSSVLQHICVYNIRFQILSGMYRVLKPGGWISIEMGFGRNGRNYYDNFYEATGTNSHNDVAVDSVYQLQGDLSRIGFGKLSYRLEPDTWRINDGHEYLIFFKAQK